MKNWLKAQVANLRYGRLQICATLGAAVMLLAGCSTMPVATRSGQPEVTISGSTEQVKAAIANHFVDFGYQVRAADAMTMIFERDAGVGAAIFLGTPYDMRVFTRYRITVIDQGNGRQRVVGALRTVQNAHSGRERETNFGGEPEVLQRLQHLKAMIENPALPGAPAAPLPAAVTATAP